MYGYCQGPWVPKTYSKSTKGRVEIARREEEEREEVLLVESSGHSESPSEESSHEIWLPDLTADVDQDQPEVSRLLLFVQ